MRITCAPDDVLLHLVGCGPREFLSHVSVRCSSRLVKGSGQMHSFGDEVVHDDEEEGAQNQYIQVHVVVGHYYLYYY